MNREKACAILACSLGKKLKVPVYVFLKEALIRKYREDFYEALDATKKHLDEKGKLPNIGQLRD